MKRESSVDFIKFFLSIVIVFFHFGLFVRGGYLAVEGFFMISGFLMMRSMYKAKDASLSADGTARFVFHKYSAIFLPLLFSAIFGFLIWEILILRHDLPVILQNIPLLLFEIFPLQIAGYSGYFSTGVSWYLGALFLSIALLHPFAKKDPERFSFTVCPLIVIFGYGILCLNFFRLEVPCEWMFNFLSTGLVRGLAGISAGCLLYTFVARSKGKTAPSMAMRIVYTILEVLGWAFAILCMSHENLIRTPMDFVCVATIFGVLYIALAQKSLFPLFIHHRWTGVLSTISTYVFLNHYAWNQYVIRRFAHLPHVQILPWYLLGIVGFSLLTWALTLLTRHVLCAIKKQKNRAEGKSDNERRCFYENQ